MIRPVGAFLLVFALLCLIVHQIGMCEFLAAVATSLLLADVMIARLWSHHRQASPVLREPLL